MGTLSMNPRGRAATPAYTLRALAQLLRYPDESLRTHLPELLQALRVEAALTRSRLEEIETLVARMRSGSAMEVEAEYVDTFDRGRGTALHLFEHVHGDSRDRGPAMVDLTRTYEQAGLFLSPDELPDHLGVVLEYASTQPPAQAREFLGELTHILQRIFSALLGRRSGYASVVAAVLELAGEKAQAVTLPEEPPLDESWAEPEAFGGCSSAGQARPGTAQPVQVIKRTAPRTGAHP